MFKYSLALLMLSFTCASAQVNSNRLSIVPEKPIPGKSLELVYHSQYGTLSKSKPVKAAFYQFSNYAWHTDTVLMQPDGRDAKASFNLLPAASFAAVKFYQGSFRSPDSIDNNQEKGYTINLTDKKGKKLPGGALAKALFKLPGYKGGLPDYFASKSPMLSADSLQLLLNEELKQKGSEPSKFAIYYLNLQSAIMGEKFKTEAPAMIDKLLEGNNLEENDLIELQRLAQFELKDATRGAAIQNEILKKYPKGNFARLQAFRNATQNVRSNEKIIANSEVFLKNFPISEWRQHPDRQDYIYYSLYRNLAAAYFESGDYDALQHLRPDWDFKTENEVYRWNIERAYMLKSVPVAKLQSLADSLYKDLLAKVNDKSYLTDFDSYAAAKENAFTQLKNRTENEINIHYQNGDYKGALTYYELLRPQERFANADINALHLDLLDKTAQKQMIQPLLENSLRNNAVTPEMFARLKQLYTAQHGNADGYDNYLASLKSADKLSELQASVRAHLTHVNVDSFDMEDLNGNMVHSSDWGDKIVVIDFWATWCRPCLAAFPGMQMLVDKYAKDPNVDFYFVGTMQSGDYKQKVKDFITREGWRFKVLHDGVNPKSGEQNAVFSKFAKLFNSSGIPRKIILKNGVMRYTTEGYSGSPSELVDEISYAIELLKAEK